MPERSSGAPHRVGPTKAKPEEEQQVETPKIDRDWFNPSVRTVIDVLPDELRDEESNEVIGQKESLERPGYYRWRIEVAFKAPGDRRGSIGFVRVESPEEPDVIGKRVEFDDIYARFYSIDGNAGLSYSAGQWAAVDSKPSVKRAKAADQPVPPAPTPDPVTPAGKR